MALADDSLSYCSEEDWGLTIEEYYRVREAEPVVRVELHGPGGR